MTTVRQFAIDRRGPGQSWIWILCYGLMLAALGISALLEPIATALATGLLLAIVLIVGGGVALAAGFTSNGWRHRWLDAFVGLLSLTLGGLVLWNPFFGAFSLIWGVGLWLMLCGGAELTAGWKPALHRPWLLLLGAVDIALGIYLILAGPADALVILAVLVALSFLVRGVLLTIFALRLRHARG